MKTILEKARDRWQFLRQNTSAIDAVCKSACEAESAMRRALDAMFKAPTRTTALRQAVLDAGTVALTRWEEAVRQWERSFPGVLPPMELAMVPYSVDDSLHLLDYYERPRPTA